ncbi:hypothetical protein [Desulfovibrio aminophilus]|uniref:hypothetical protein n=1 Tax=Desulfovibrio aminophilus TaxID=81425 RepID=UPI00339A6D5E
MTHTLHRRGTEESLKTDYVVFAITAQSVNAKGMSPVFGKFFEIVKKYNPDNMGDMRQGSVLSLDYKSIVDNVQDNTIAHAVFNDAETVREVVKELKAADLGASIVVSGLREDTAKIAHATKTELHTQEVSLGIHGKLEKLPSEPVLEVTTMCGHGMIAAKLVEHLADKVKRGKMTAHKAAMEVAKQCTCGVGNIKRTEALIRAMAEK